MDLDKMSIEELVALHRAKRSQLAAIRSELDQIEKVLHPQQAKLNAIKKLKKAGLSAAELESLK